MALVTKEYLKPQCTRFENFKILTHFLGVPSGRIKKKNKTLRLMAMSTETFWCYPSFHNKNTQYTVDKTKYSLCAIMWLF